MFFPRLPRRALRLALLVLVLPSFGSAAVVPAVVLDANGNLVLRWTGEIGEHYRVETSSDLVTWTQLPGEYSGAAMAFAPVVVAAGQPATAKRFWRVVTANRAFFRLTYSTTPEIVAGVAMPPVVASLVFADSRAPVSYGITAGTLPPGLVLDPATGAIHGVPAQTGVSSFTVTATNGALVASAVFKWWVQPDPDGTAIFRDATPLSTLLPPGATTLEFTVATTQAANCRYSVGTDLGYAAMQSFTSGQGTTTHGVTFNGLSADPTKLNRVFVRCDAAPTQLLQLKYRAITGANPSFPRKANLWGWSNFFPNGSVDHAKRIDLWMGVHAGPDQVMPLRGVHPDVVVMESCSAVEQSDTNAWMVPEDYWLRDVDGNRVKAWGGMYRLNLTKPEVARFQARYAYQRLVDGDLCMDGLFFDNFLTSHPTVFVYDANTSFVVDADGDGQKDAPDQLSDAWRAGVYREMIEFRKLMPHALVAGHLEDHEIETEGDFFSGDSMGLVMPEFKDGPAFKDGHDMFRKFWDPYHSWWTWGLRPILTTIEGAPPNELSYGYGEKVTTDMPASTLEFARTCYPYMRWGLGVALMNDGYSMYEHGDNYHGPDWWYDELDFNLGYPLGPCQRLDLGTVPATDSFRNGGFDAALAPAWTTWVNTNRGAVASFTRDTTQAGTGAACCRVDIVEPGLGANGQIIEWDVRLDQTNVEVIAGMAYDISFRARSTSGPHHVSVGAGTNWESGTGFEVGDTWRTYSSVVVGKVAAMNAIVSINFGAQTGTVWIDEVKLVQHQPHIYRRDFDNGTVILNGSKERQVIPVTGAYKRLGGTQAPLYQYVIDDVAPAFTAGGWGAAVYDSRLKQSTGPYFHDWGAGCHQSSIVNNTATWDLGIRADDTYMLDAWWPAAPAASGWSSAVRYDVTVGGVMVATKTFDQTKQGDQWHRIASVALTKAAGAQVRITNLQAKPAIADAILVQSAARYNDGSDAPSVALDPCDAIILEKKR